MSKNLFFTAEDGSNYPEWKEKTLGEILELCQSGTSLNQNLYAKGLPVTRIETISSGKIDLSKVGYVDTPLSIEKHLLKVDDILFSNINSIEHIAKTAIVHSEFPKLYHGMNLLLLRTDNDNSGQFLFHYLNTDMMRAYFRKIANKAISQASINQTAVAKTQLSVPSLAEQRKIAEFFSVLDERIALTADKVKLLKEQKTGYLQRIFDQELVFTDDNGDRYPEWEQKKLGGVAKILRGNGLNKASITANGKVPCVLYGQLFSLYGAEITKVVSHTDEKANTLSKMGDILMPTSDVTPSGLATASCLMVDDVLLGSDMNVIRSDDSVFPLFLTYQINFDKKKIIDKVSGTTVKHIYPKDLLGLEYVFPSLAEQEKIAEFFSALDEQIELTEKKFTLLKEQKKGYLQGIFG